MIKTIVLTTNEIDVTFKERERERESKKENKYKMLTVGFFMF